MLEDYIILWKLKGIVDRMFINGKGEDTIVLQHPGSSTQIYIWYGKKYSKKDSNKERYVIREIKQYASIVSKTISLDETVEWANR